MSVERIAEFTRLDDDHDVLVQPAAPPSLPVPATAATAASAAAAATVDAIATAASVAPTTRLAEPAGEPAGELAGAARGRVELRDVWLRYRPHEPPVLRGIHLRLAAGTKLAVCGRSGCGKTSLLRALVRACSLTFCGYTYSLWLRQDDPILTMAAVRPFYTRYGCGKTILLPTHLSRPTPLRRASTRSTQARCASTGGTSAPRRCERRARPRGSSRRRAASPTAILTIWLYDLLVLTYDLVLTFLLYYGHAYSCT